MLKRKQIKTNAGYLQGGINAALPFNILSIYKGIYTNNNNLDTSRPRRSPSIYSLLKFFRRHAVIWVTAWKKKLHKGTIFILEAVSSSYGGKIVLRNRLLSNASVMLAL